MSYLDIVRAQLSTDEGYRKMPYKDSVGKITVGVGRNLTDVGVRDDEIALMLTNDIAVAEKASRNLVPNFEDLTDARKAVVINMAFNLGESSLETFTETLKAIAGGRWNDAADLMLLSKWATQVGARARRLSDAMRAG